MKYEFIREQISHFKVRKMCHALKVSPSGYYYWFSHPMSPRKERNERLLAEIRAIHARSRKVYGSPRVTLDLRDMGFICGHNRVARLMRENQIVSTMKRKFKATTNSKHHLPVAPNLLQGGVSVTGPNQVWVSDITYIPTGEGWLYLATVMDYFSRQVVGWSMKGRMTRDLVMDALQQAIWRRRPRPGFLHHSDRGSQYASGDYQSLLKSHGFLCSMSGKGNCYDNALMESFYGTLKTELVHHEKYRTREEAKRSIFEYIEIFYNRIRRHSSLGYRSPAAFELLANAA